MFSHIHNTYGEKVILLDSGKNGGYGYGNNVGIKEASGNYIVVMNPDIRLVSPIFSSIINILKSGDSGMIGVDFVDGSSPYYFKRGHSNLLRGLFPQFYIWRGEYNSKDMFMSGSFLAFEKKALISAGMFDENIFMYSEEADITNRILEKGYKVEWHPELKVLHLAHNRDYNPNLDRIRHESGKYYMEKYHVDEEKEYRLNLKILEIKKIVAMILGRKDKELFFRNMICSLREFHDDTN